MTLCPNCQSDKHRKCCARCGALIRGRRALLGLDYCTARCGRLQAEADRISADMEHEQENDNGTR